MAGTRPLKVWSMIGPAVYENGAQVSGAQSRRIVAATSAKAAALALGVTAYELDRSGSVTGNEEEIRVALSRPGIGSWQPLTEYIHRMGQEPERRDMTWRPLPT
jgi:hypothetical protein